MSNQINNMTNSSVCLYDDFVVVAEDQCKIWECIYNYYCQSLTLGFNSFARGRITEVHLEVLLCDEKFQPFPGFPMRQMLTTDSNIWKHEFEKRYDCFNMTIRVLKDRPFFPDFTSKDVRIGDKKSNGKLRVGDHVFHVNKEVLSIYSPYFENLFNNTNFDEAKKDMIDMNGVIETKDPALFHDFLMTISLPNKNFQNALPNVHNVAGLLALAQCYQVDMVRDKCEQHLKFCREMAFDERLLLARKYGLKELQFHIVQEMNSLKDCKELFYAFLEADP